MRAQRRSVAIQTATGADNNLENILTWATTTTLPGTITPAGRAEIERATMLGRRITATVVLPGGVTLKPLSNRVIADGVTYEVLDVVSMPRRVIGFLEAVE